jgi:hypothetical protein
MTFYIFILYIQLCSFQCQGLVVQRAWVRSPLLHEKSAYNLTLITNTTVFLHGFQFPPVVILDQQGVNLQSNPEYKHSKFKTAANIVSLVHRFPPVVH